MPAINKNERPQHGSRVVIGCGLVLGHSAFAAAAFIPMAARGTWWFLAFRLAVVASYPLFGVRDVLAWRPKRAAVSSPPASVRIMCSYWALSRLNLRKRLNIDCVPVLGQISGKHCALPKSN